MPIPGGWILSKPHTYFTCTPPLAPFSSFIAAEQTSTSTPAVSYDWRKVNNSQTLTSEGVPESRRYPRGLWDFYVFAVIDGGYCQGITFLRTLGLMYYYSIYFGTLRLALIVNYRHHSGVYCYSSCCLTDCPTTTVALNTTRNTTL